MRSELTTLVEIGTDYIGSHKSNYHTITTLTIPCLSENKHLKLQYALQNKRQSMESKQQTGSTFNILVDHNVPERPLKMDFGDNRNYETAFSRLFDGSEKYLTITSARHALYLHGR